MPQMPRCRRKLADELLTPFGAPPPVLLCHPLHRLQIFVDLRLAHLDALLRRVAVQQPAQDQVLHFLRIGAMDLRAQDLRDNRHARLTVSRGGLLERRGIPVNEYRFRRHRENQARTAEAGLPVRGIAGLVHEVAHSLAARSQLVRDAIAAIDVHIALVLREGACNGGRGSLRARRIDVASSLGGIRHGGRHHGQQQRRWHQHICQTVLHGCHPRSSLQRVSRIRGQPPY